MRGVTSEVVLQWEQEKGLDFLFIDGIHSYMETDPLILTPEAIAEYQILGWMQRGKLVPPSDHTPAYDRGAKVDFDAWTPKIKNGVFSSCTISTKDHPAFSEFGTKKWSLPSPGEFSRWKVAWNRPKK